MKELRTPEITASTEEDYMELIREAEKARKKYMGEAQETKRADARKVRAKRKAQKKARKKARKK